MTGSAVQQSAAAAAAEYWNQWQAHRSAQPSGPFIDFGDHPEVVGRVCEHLFGTREVGFMDYIRQQLPNPGQSRVLSLCCGDGTFECALVEQGVFGAVTGMDISPARVAAGNARIAASTTSQGQPLAERVQLRCADVNQADYGQGLYDVVLAKSSLHHFDPANPDHNAVIREAVDWEQQLIAQGMLPSDFRLIIGQPRKTSLAS